MLEDNAERITRFQAVLASLAPSIPLMIWRNAHLMMQEAGPHLPFARLVCLDHDLEPDVDGIDPGDGYMVTQWLVSQPYHPPVLIHTSNVERASWMQGAFDLAKWRHRSVAPIGDDWIENDWQRIVRKLLK